MRMTASALAAALREIQPRWEGDVQHGRWQTVADHLEAELELTEDLAAFLSCVRKFSLSDAHRELATEAFLRRRGA